MTEKNNGLPTPFPPLNDDELREIARDLYGDQLSGDQLKRIIEETHYIRAAGPRISLEHLRIGSAILTILNTTARALSTHDNAKQDAPNMARAMTYKFLERTHGYTQNVCDFYLRQYEVFTADDSSAV